ncbi:CLUMA_CG006827, isoform A [Clunio marinus]|uniref:CLUMA_CG006827, isoform A n=1 Tax=Clunio marinus TaxID=568069 RepID=A0A1J1I123_9DIPT|nr:CLUMA_CG006827, isoform A [Clunio marinus]
MIYRHHNEALFSFFFSSSHGTNDRKRPKNQLAPNQNCLKSTELLITRLYLTGEARKSTKIKKPTTENTNV